MSEFSTDLDPLEPLLDEFTSRFRRGESPSVSEYAARHPQHAAQIEELFPAIAVMEQLRADERSKREAAARRSALANPPQHLGDFQIIREIGRGGMGIVYEAEQRSLARRVAVKVLPKHSLLLDKHLQRFQREAQITARLHHTNIVPIFGVGEQDGLHYYVMPLVRGVGLDEIIRELQAAKDASQADAKAGGSTGFSAQEVHGLVRKLTARKFAAAPMPEQVGEEEDGRPEAARASRHGGRDYWQLVAQIGVQAAEGLDYAHGQGTLHRDIKPANLLLGENGVVCVADFGLARAMDDSDVSRSGDFVGTASYVAPEQLHGTADVRSDIYALGLTLYELLTLRPASDPKDRAVCLRTRQPFPEPVRPRKIHRRIPRDLETIVLKCLAWEPAKRYQTAAALSADLRRFVEDRPIRARRASAAERVGRWCRRNPALAAVSALALLLLVACSATALAGYLQTRTAYAETRKALKQAEATSQLSLRVLNGIYLKLSPQRIWIASDSDPAGQTCACIGLGTGDGSATSVERTALQLWALPETAVLLENLLAFYDLLAEQGGDDRRLVLQSAGASRRVGDIRLCLGEIYRAEEAYLRALEKLTPLRAQMPADIEINTELAHCHNEIGNVRSARREARRAYQSHQAALRLLQSCAPTERPTAEYQYELARTFYFLARKSSIAPDDARSRAGDVRTLRFASPPSHSHEYRQSAIRTLEELISANPHAPDYRLLLALCCREMGAAPGSGGSSRSSPGRQRAIRLLEDLTAEYPGVADYRYELIATYAWIPVSLFPWQGRFTVSREGEQSLRQALDESQWLVSHNPTVPHYARCQALLLAKLATACWLSQRLSEAEGFFQQAVQTQNVLVAKFPELPPHDQVLLEFFRLRLAQVGLQRNAGVDDPGALATSQELLKECIRSLTQLTGKPELAGDQLARSSLPIAYDALSEVLARSGQQQEAAEAKKKGELLRSELRAKSKSQPSSDLVRRN